MLGWLWRFIRSDKSIILLAGLATSVLIAALYVHQPWLFRFLDRKIYDLMLRDNSHPVATQVPIIVDIDEESLEKYGQWPWPRYRIALLLDALNQAGVLSAATDIVFAEPDRTSVSRIKNEITKQFGQYLQGDLTIGNLPEVLQDNDLLLAETLKTGPFVLGYTLEFMDKGHGSGGADHCGVEPLNLAYKTENPGLVPDPQYALFNAADAVCPLPELTGAAPRCGFFTTSTDIDGVIRRVPLLMYWNGKVFPNLALRALLVGTQGRALILSLTPAGSGSLLIGIKDPATGEKRKIEIPLDHRGQLFVNYRGGAGTFEYVSAGKVLDQDPETMARLQGRIAFIGTSASGLKDLRVTPFDQYYPGVETHANVIDSILAEDFLLIPDWEPGLQIFLILLAGVLTTLLLTWTRAVLLALPLGLLGAGMWFASDAIFAGQRMFISPLYGWIILGANFTLLTLLKFWREEKQKRFIHGAFAHYLSPTVIDQIVDNPDVLSLDGAEKEITIMFSDVRSFTSLSEKLTPTQVTNLLHDYLTPMTRIITSNQGTLDKFIGDAVMAFWNAPLDVPGHQRLAVRSALAQLDKLAELNEEFKVKYGFPIAIGLGINSGTVRVGNMGSADLFDYTLIGDNVNLASRLEGLTKFYGQQIIVSQAIRDACGDEFAFQEVDSVRVKGKAEPVTICTVMSHEQAAERAGELERYDELLAFYKAGRFAEAGQGFAALREKHDQLLYAMYQERCGHLEQEPPGADWDGVFTHKTK